MNRTNVQLIFCREVRDQLRDRRTLFMIAVLPLLLYPLLGMTMFQVAQFVREHATKVLVLGEDELPAVPPLMVDEDGSRRFAEHLFADLESSRLLELHFADEAPTDEVSTAEAADAWARQAVEQGEYEVAIHFPRDFAARLEQVRGKLAARRGGEQSLDLERLLDEVPSPKIHYNTAREASAITYARVSDVLRRWEDDIARENLAAGGVPELAARPFDVSTHDVADEAGRRGAAMWSKVLPFLLLIWALTGAFYPAVDLCAGEKERGTLETLLSSPAQRSEIVLGKLLTVMLFSVATAVLNLVSMGVTGQLILSQLPDFGPPPPLAPLWLAIALLPMSALFSAICLALAAFARSSKEGQYYLMPVLLVTMPLVILPMSPGFELTIGNSLIPVTGVVLLLRAALEGTPWQQVLPFVPPVAAVTVACCVLAIRWAVDQFNSESVLFNESERFDLGLWLRHLKRDREATPNVATAAFGGVLILTLMYLMGFLAPAIDTFGEFAGLTLAVQIAVIASPALLMTVMLTRSPRQTLLLRWPRWATLPAAVLLAVALNPLVQLLQVAVAQLYPVNEEVARAVQKLFALPHPFWLELLVFALAPALCEELAFRGFVLSGLRHLGSKWRAIFLSSLLFGLAHTVFQQSIVACLVGMAIGYLAVQTGSLLPCVLFHVTHNCLGLLNRAVTADCLAEYPWLSYFVRPLVDGSYGYRPWTVAAGGLTAIGLLYWLHSLRHMKTPEESLRDALDHSPVRSLA